jgi:hypothetical protein
MQLEPWLVGWTLADRRLEMRLVNYSGSARGSADTSRPSTLDLDGCIIRAFCGFVSIHTWAVYLLAEASIRLVIGKLEPV